MMRRPLAYADSDRLVTSTGCAAAPRRFQTLSYLDYSTARDRPRDALDRAAFLRVFHTLSAGRAIRATSRQLTRGLLAESPVLTLMGGAAAAARVLACPSIVSQIALPVPASIAVTAFRPEVWVHVRSRARDAALRLRNRLHTLDPQVPLSNVQSLAAQLDEARATPGISAQLSAGTPRSRSSSRSSARMGRSRPPSSIAPASCRSVRRTPVRSEAFKLA
jgi:hypothetical protein